MYFERRVGGREESEVVGGILRRVSRHDVVGWSAPLCVVMLQ